MFDFLFKKRELLPLPYKRELHCHIIPGVDDGSQNMDDSIEYLKRLEQFGVEKVVFTPHHTVPHFLNTPEKIQPLFDELSVQMKEKGLKIEPEGFSFEYRVDEGFLEMMKTGRYGDPGCVIRPLRGKYLLIENGWNSPIPALDDVIDRLLEQGYYLVMAHPERYIYYAGNHGHWYRHLQEHQVQFQCNILSFAGHYGDVSRKMARWMLEEGYVNFLGSDLHHYGHCDHIENFLRSKDYAEIYEDLCDSINNDHI